MAKELPYFKFEPNAWENGNIQMLSREDKGLFIDICSMYWSRLSDLPEKLVIQKLCFGNASALIPLYEENIIELIDGNIYVKFLSIQLISFENTSNQNSENAKERWRKHREQKDSSDRNATATNSQSESDAIREEKSKVNKIKETIDFSIFWDLYGKKIERKSCERKWEKLSLETQEKIIETLPAFKESITDKKYLPHPETYLNGERWNDEIEQQENKQEYTGYKPQIDWVAFLKEQGND